MNLEHLIENPLELDADGVWVRPNAKPFGYTDGRASEEYLERVLAAASDLGSNSRELTAAIKDWPSEYHLSPTRAQLLRGFDYDRGKRVLEVGCGCGAITRFLGETFDSVTSIEGSHARARLARMRTRDLDHVTIVNSPFEEIRFSAKFDIVFCIGVFEYASMFVEGDDPHRKILAHFDHLLAPGGVLVLAIENKLGLKYFSSSAEDHTGVMFDGVEGYPRFARKAKTFGRRELVERLEPHFESIEFLYPWPDYKIPSCVLSEPLLERVDPTELIGSFRSVDYGHRARQPLFDESLAWRSLVANGLTASMAHSFLVVATKAPRTGLRLDCAGRLYSSHRRRPEFATLTRFEDAEKGLDVVKARADGSPEFVEGKLAHRACSDTWIEGASLQDTMARRARARGMDLTTMLEPTRIWFGELDGTANGDGRVPGERLDSIWRNCFVTEDGCRYIDREWAWTDPLPLTLIVARGLYYFAQSLLDAPSLNPTLARMRIDAFIAEAGAAYGLTLDADELAALTRFEAAFLDQVTGSSKDRVTDVSAVLRRRLSTRRPGSSSSLPRRGARWLKRRLRR
jgi:SAM-dependent methyltransferase